MNVILSGARMEQAGRATCSAKPRRVAASESGDERVQSSIVSQLNHCAPSYTEMLLSAQHDKSDVCDVRSTRPCPKTTLLHSENPTAPHGRRDHGWVAQLAEQWTENPRVGGSIPPPAIPLKIRALQQILQQNLAMREFINCGRTLLKLMA